MNPATHLSSFLLGMATCLIYRRYMEDRAAGEGSNSSSTRFFEFIAMNVGVRYPMYLLSIALMAGPVFWMNQLVMGNASDRYSLDALVVFAFPMFCLGLAMLVLPALGGKAQLFRLLFGSEAWTMRAASAPGLMYCYPLVAIFYFLSSEHQVQFDYYMMVYYFSGNLIFGFAIYTMVLLHTDRPLAALKALKEDIEDAEANELYRLETYIENFRVFADAAYEEIVDNSLARRGILLEEHNEAMRKIPRFDSNRLGSDDDRETLASANARVTRLPEAKGRASTQKLGLKSSDPRLTGPSFLSVVSEEIDDVKK